MAINNIVSKEPDVESSFVRKPNEPIKEASVSVDYQTDPNTMSANEMTPGGMPSPRVSMGNPGANNVKTSGIVQRGAGAATKGKTARGPMA